MVILWSWRDEVSVYKTLTGTSCCVRHDNRKTSRRTNWLTGLKNNTRRFPHGYAFTNANNSLLSRSRRICGLLNGADWCQWKNINSHLRKKIQTPVSANRAWHGGYKKWTMIVRVTASSRRTQQISAASFPAGMRKECSCRICFSSEDITFTSVFRGYVTRSTSLYSILET